MFERFAIFPIDTAGYNIGIIYKKYYIDVLKKELGINNNLGIKGNDVYLPVHQHKDDILNFHENYMLQNCNIKTSDKDHSLPLIFWIPKLHKNPYKSRFIAGATNCSTKQLSVEVTLCLITIRKHFHKYCSAIQQYTGINYFWSFNNSMEFISKLKNSKAKTIHTVDF